MAQITGKQLSVYLGLSFLCGIFVGYKLKAWRIKYLQTKRDFMARKMMDAQKQLNAATT